MAFEHEQMPYPKRVKLCPKCKACTLWEMQPNWFRCKGCGWRSIGTGDLTFEGAPAQEFIRMDIIEEALHEFLDPHHRLDLIKIKIEEYFVKNK